MRLLRLRVANFRGLAAAEIVPGRDGVTIVEGPNEAGKSSLLEALDLLLAYRADSGAEAVRRVRPRHADLAPEVEAELEVGGWTFTYWKRFYGRGETRLSVHAPKPEDLTGREAHDRVGQILSAAVDLSLWRSLRIVQGAALGLPELSGNALLTQALDRAAGTASTSPREESLFERVQAEAATFFDARGNEKKPLREAAAARAAAARAAEELEERLRALERDVERTAQLACEIVKIEADRTRLDAAAAGARAARERLEGLRRELAEREAVRVRAEAEQRAAAAARDERQALVRRVAEFEERVARLAGERAAGAPARERVLERLAEAERAAAAARVRAAAAETRRDLAQKDWHFRNDQLALAQMRERLARVDAAEARGADAERTVAAVTVTQADLDGIRAAALEVERARARLEAQVPELRLTARVPLEIRVDGAARRLAAGEVATLPVPVSTTVEISDLAEVAVRSGTDAQALERARDAAERELRERLAAARVESVDAAAAALERRQAAERELAERDRVREADLRDLTRASLEARIEATAARVAAYTAARPSEPPLPADLDEAGRELRRIDAEVCAAGEARETAARELAGLQGAVQKLLTGDAEAGAHLEHATRDLEAARRLLADARAAASDDDLAGRLAAAEQALRAAVRASRDAAAELAAAEPERVEAEAENARRAAEGAARELALRREELSKLRGQLEARGEEGLYEEAERAKARTGRLAAEDDRLRARAAAAKLLAETFKAAREEARRTYLAPLRERVDRLGRIVFGDGFAVELDEELRIASRTLAGRTVPFADLSAGTREQLGLLVRIACAQLAAPDGGVPLFLDDALGYSDPERVERMGAVLAVAGRDIQLLVLTCVPERYRNVGGATRVRLA